MRKYLIIIFSVVIYGVFLSVNLSSAKSEPSDQERIILRTKNLARTIRSNISQIQFLKDASKNGYRELDAKSQKYVTAIEKVFSNNNVPLFRKKVKKFVHDVPGSWVAHFYMSLVYQLEDNVDEAYLENEKAFELNPDALILKIIKINILIERNEFLRAQTMLNELLSKYTDMPLAIYLQGLNNKKSQHFIAAIKDFKYLLKLQPNYRLAHLELIDIYRSLQQGEKALNEINHILDSSPEWTQVKFLQGSTMLENQDIAGAKRVYAEIIESEKNKYLKAMLGLSISFYDEDFDLAEEICQRLIKEFPENLDIYVSLFNVYIEQKDFDLAKKMIKKISKKFSKDFKRLSLWGDFYFSQQQYSDAIKNYKRYMQDNPYDTEGYYRLAHVYREQGQYDKSKDVYQQALVIFPDSYSFHKLLARQYRDLNILKESVKEYQKAIALMPDQYGAHVGLGTTFLRLGDLDTAIKEYTKAVTIKPNLWESYWGMSGVYLEKKEYARAISYANKAIERGPKEGGGYLTLAKIYDDMNDKVRAKGACDDFAAGRQLDAEGLSNFGLCFLQIKMYDEAFKVYKEAEAKSEGSKQIYAQLAGLYVRRKEFANALLYAQKVLDIDPDSVYGLTQMGAGYLGLGNLKKAEESYQKIFDQYQSDPKQLAAQYVEITKSIYQYRDQSAFALKCEEYLKKALEFDPSEYMTYIFLGTLYENGKNFATREKKEEALRLYEKAFYIDGGIISLGRIVTLMDSLYPKRKSLEYVKNVVNTKPSFYDAHLVLIEQYEALEKYEEAIEESLKLIVKDPTSSLAYNHLGVDYSHLGKIYQALQAWKKAVELDPTNPLAYVNLAFTYENIDSWSKVIDVGNKAIDLGYKEGSIFESVAIAYHRQGLIAKALDYFKQAVELAPESCTQNSIGYFYLTQSRYQDALPHLLKAIKYCKGLNKSKAYYNLGSVYLKLNEPTKAEAARRQSQKIQSQSGNE